MPLTAMGVQPDAYKYLDTLAKLYDIPELRDFVPMVQEAQPPQERVGGGKLPQPGKPNGQYTRNNVSQGMTDKGMAQQREMMVLAGGGEQQGN